MRNSGLLLAKCKILANRAMTASDHFKMIKRNYQRRQQQQQHQSASMHICSEDAVPGFSLFASCWLVCCTLQPAVRSERRCQHSSRPRDWSRWMLRPVRGTLEDHSGKKTLCNMFQINLNDCEMVRVAEGSPFRCGSDEWPAPEMEENFMAGAYLFAAGPGSGARSLVDRHRLAVSTRVRLQSFVVTGFGDVCETSVVCIRILASLEPVQVI